MPIYDFRCNDCAKVSEIYLVSMNVTPSCPVCNSDNMTRLISTRFAVRNDGMAFRDPDPDKQVEEE